MNDIKGKIVIISSPSGGGKTSICRELLSDLRVKEGWQFSISDTTRQMRQGEKDGREYNFITEDEFEKKIAANYYAEHFKVHLYNYGTPREPLEAVLKNGGVMLLDVDVQGAERLKAEYPEAVTIFILPPSEEELQKRLIQRGTETEEQLAVRFENAKEEMKLHKMFDHTVVNNELKTAVEEVLAIIQNHSVESAQ